MADKSLIKVSIELLIEAEPYQVFNALTTGTAIWWSTPYLQRKDARDLIMEPKVGGRFYERWTLNTNDSKGALHAIVVAIDTPRLLRLQGPFGMAERAAWGTATIELKPVNDNTYVHFYFSAFGDLNDSIETEYNRGWNDLLTKLKFFVEEGAAQGVKHDPSLSLD